MMSFSTDFLSLFGGGAAGRGRRASVVASRFKLGKASATGAPTRRQTAYIKAANAVLGTTSRAAGAQQRSVGGMTISGKSQARSILKALTDMGVNVPGRKATKPKTTAAATGAAQGRQAGMARRAGARRRKRQARETGA